MKSVDNIVMNEVSCVMGVGADVMMSSSRKANVVAARIIAAKILKELSCMGENEIGDVLDRDHASIQYYLKTFQTRYEYDRRFRMMYETCLKNAIGKII